MEFTGDGRMTNPSFFDYKIPNTEDIPDIEVILVESSEPTGPMGAKSVGEIGINGAIPAISNAVRDAVGIQLNPPPGKGLGEIEGLIKNASTLGIKYRGLRRTNFPLLQTCF